MADYKNAYGKKPWWFWALVYLVIGGLLYYAIYYFAYANKGGYNKPSGQNQGVTY